MVYRISLQGPLYLLLSGGLDGKELYLQGMRPGFDPWVGKIPWRKEWQPTPIFLPGEFHRQRSLGRYSLWGHKESDITEQLTTTSLRDLIRSKMLAVVNSHICIVSLGCSPSGLMSSVVWMLAITSNKAHSFS